MKDGYVKAYRKMLSNPVVMKDAEHFAVWMWLLLNATHGSYDTIFKGEKITLSNGQMVTGRVKIAQELKISESKVERILKSFESEHQIEQQKSNKNRLITVVKWREYQKSEQQNEQQLNNNWTTTEQQLNTYNNIYNNTLSNNSHVSNDLHENEKNVEECIKSSCGEPEKALPTPQEPVFIKIPLVDKTEFDVTESMVKEFKEAYPAVDVEQQLRNMRQWSIANPSNRKTRNGAMRFINNWLMKDQNRGGSRKQSGKQSSLDEWAARRDGVV